MTSVTPEGKLLGLIKEAQGKRRLRKELKLFTKINIALIALIVLILIVFLVDLFTSDYNNSELMVELPKDEVEEVLPLVEDIEEEIIIEKKDTPSKEELAKDLSILGIITGEDEQVIIKDRSANKTFFLYKGDSFGEFKISEIKDTGVILDYKGEKIELNM